MGAPNRLSPAAASAVEMAHMCVDYVTATWAMSAPSANVRRVRVGTCTRTCAAKLRGNASAVAEGNAPATAAAAMRVNLGRSMGCSASAMTSPVQDTRASFAQVGVRLPHQFSLKMWA